MPDFDKFRQEFKNQVSPMKRTTICVAPVLASEWRAEQRKEFDYQVQSKQLDRELETEIKRAIQEASQEDELRLLRSQSNFKATPIRKFKPVNSVDRIPLTVPESPTFETSKRADMR